MDVPESGVATPDRRKVCHIGGGGLGRLGTKWDCQYRGHRGYKQQEGVCDVENGQSSEVESLEEKELGYVARDDQKLDDGVG